VHIIIFPLSCVSSSIFPFINSKSFYSVFIPISIIA
jgi:hypothetical protein